MELSRIQNGEEVTCRSSFHNSTIYKCACPCQKGPVIMSVKTLLVSSNNFYRKGEEEGILPDGFTWDWKECLSSPRCSLGS